MLDRTRLAAAFFVIVFSAVTFATLDYAALDNHFNEKMVFTSSNPQNYPLVYRDIEKILSRNFANVLMIFTSALLIMFVALWVITSRAIANAQFGKKIESEKDEICAQLIQTSRLACVGEMAAGLAHEIGNLLQTISGNAELLIQSGANGSGEGAIIKESAVAAKKILADIMDFAHQKQMSFYPEDVREPLEATLKIYGRQLAFQNIKVVREYQPELPHLYISPAALEQVFLNVILNSQKAMPSGGRLLIKIFRQDQWVSVVFKDTGVGIKKKDLPELFKPFFTTWHDGHGLGLNVSFRIVRHHGGEMSIMSDGEGQGAEVEIKLPLDFDTEAAHAAKPSDLRELTKK